MDSVVYSDTDTLETAEVLELYRSVEWSAAEKPDKLLAALRNSDTLITARLEGKLIGIGNAISDGHLVVYYPHLLVYREYQGRGIGREIVKRMLEPYKEFHQQMLTADSQAIAFYTQLGFTRAEGTDSLWIYKGNDH